MRGLVRAALAALILAATVSGCAARYKPALAPGCHKTDTLVLMAQSVPSADLVPCIEALPAGWSFEDLEVRRGTSSFSLDSDRAGNHAVEVELFPSCRLGRATEIASDEVGTRRFERVESVVGEYRGTRYYLFDGGCVTYRFKFSRQGLAFVNEVSLAIGFIARDAVAELADRRL
ncbi:MAG: hypothetical protein M3203_10070 [Actinomycetota bacterium]|nr:hypothetical protein [Actinomycetota bacterium]